MVAVPIAEPLLSSTAAFMIVVGATIEIPKMHREDGGVATNLDAQLNHKGDATTETNRLAAIALLTRR